MKTITDIKKALAVGSFWHAVNHRMLDKDMGVREVGANTATQFAFKQADGELSYCNWPKKAEVGFIGEDGFTIYEDGEPVLTYTKADKPAPVQADPPASEDKPAPDADDTDVKPGRRASDDEAAGSWDKPAPEGPKAPSVTVLSSGVKVKTLAVITNPPRTLPELELDIKKNLLNIVNSALRVGGLLALGREFHESQAVFLTWAEDKFSLGKSQVYKLMKIHQEFGEDARFKGVAMRVMAQLSGAPDSVKQAAAELAKQGKLDSKAAEKLTAKPVVNEAGEEQAPLTIEQLDSLTTINPATPAPESGAEQGAPFDTGTTIQPESKAPEGHALAQEAVILKPETATTSPEMERLLAQLNELMEQNGKLQAQLAALNKPKKAATPAPMLRQFKHADPCIVLGISQEEGKVKKEVKAVLRELAAIWNADTNLAAWGYIETAANKLLETAA